MPGVDNSLQHLEQLWTQRDFRRRTNGNPERSRALVLLHALANPLAATKSDSKATPAPLELNLPYMEDLAKVMAASWAGESGYDDHATTKAIGAAKATTTIHPKTQEPGPQ